MKSSPEERARGIASILELWAKANGVRLPEDVIDELEQLIRLAITASVDEAVAPYLAAAAAANGDLRPSDAPFETASWIVPSYGAAAAPASRAPSAATDPDGARPPVDS